mgnify:CR=1 FL=1
MLKPVKWSSFAEKDFALVLEYLTSKWGVSVALDFIEKTEKCVTLIQQNPKQFPFLSKELLIQRCVVTRHNTLYYRETEEKIEILRLYDTRQNPRTLQF